MKPHFFFLAFLFFILVSVTVLFLSSGSFLYFILFVLVSFSLLFLFFLIISVFLFLFFFSRPPPTPALTNVHILRYCPKVLNLLPIWASSLFSVFQMNWVTVIYKLQHEHFLPSLSVSEYNRVPNWWERCEKIEIRRAITDSPACKVRFDYPIRVSKIRFDFFFKWIYISKSDSVF